jgi:hypothetical protein
MEAPNPLQVTRTAIDYFTPMPELPAYVRAC